MDNYWTAIFGIGALAALVIGSFLFCAALIYFQVLPW